MKKIIIFLFLVLIIFPCQSQNINPPEVKFIENHRIEVKWQGHKAMLKTGESIGPWTFMSLFTNQLGGNIQSLAVFENFTERNGQLLYIDSLNVRYVFNKSLEATYSTSPENLYNGYNLDDILNSQVDLLRSEVLSKSEDPSYKVISKLIKPLLGSYNREAYTFLGTRDNFDKVNFYYGGFSGNFHPDIFAPEINSVIASKKVWDGLVGDWLPAIRFVYPIGNDDWIELMAFAPCRMVNDNKWAQPIWYRLSKIEGGKLEWIKYIDSYLPYYPREYVNEEGFYKDFLSLREGWNNELFGAMEIKVPEKRIENLARYSLVRVLMTRMGISPKYGVISTNYGHTQHDGFQDTFNSETLAMLLWGLPDIARSYISNYLIKWVNDDGSIVYRGPQIGQYGRMLTNIAQYANYTGDYDILLNYQIKIDAIAKLLLSLREKNLKLDKENPSYGLIAGFSEADACLDKDAYSYIAPYFGNNTEAIRGLREIGQVWQNIDNNERQRWGYELVQHSYKLEKDLQNSIRKSINEDTSPPCIPAIAGGMPFDEVLEKDKTAPEKYSDRSYVEMLFSGILSKDQVKTIIDYRSTHNDMVLGIPTINSRYGNKLLDGYIAYMHAYGLIEKDFVKDYLLLYYSIIAHHYSRGSWTAVEVRSFNTDESSFPYAIPAQLVAPLMTRWMILFEDPNSGELWLNKATPRDWLKDGQRIEVLDAPTPYGRINFNVISFLNNGQIEAILELPLKPIKVPIQLRLRTPEGYRLKAVTIDGKPYQAFDPNSETITLQSGMSGIKKIVAKY